MINEVKVNNFCAGHGDWRIKSNIDIKISEMKINIKINSHLTTWPL